jgi:hypothetical protein
MGVRGLARAVLVSTVAVALGSLPAAAQNVTFSTSGTLTGASCVANVCTAAPFTLSFVNAGSNTYGAPTNVDLGSFSTTCTGCTFGAGGAQNVTSAFSGILFTLQINQTAPSSGNNTFSGQVSGSLGYNPITSTLVWMPTTSTITIGAVTYALIIDNTGNIVINAPTTDQTPNLTGVKAHITSTTVTPEPSTVALMATGLFGLVPAVRRRRS